MMWNVSLQLFICMLWKCNGCISGNYWIRIIRNVHGFSEDSLEMFNHIKHGLQKCNNHCTKSKNRRTCKIDTLYIFFFTLSALLAISIFLAITFFGKLSQNSAVCQLLLKLGSNLCSTSAEYLYRRRYHCNVFYNYGDRSGNPGYYTFLTFLTFHWQSADWSQKKIWMPSILMLCSRLYI